MAPNADRSQRCRLNEATSAHSGGRAPRRFLDTEQIGVGDPPVGNGPAAVPAARHALGCSAGGRYFAST